MEFSMDEQKRSNINKFKGELVKMSQCIYLACDAPVAADVALKTKKAIKLIDNLLDEIDDNNTN